MRADAPEPQFEDPGDELLGALAEALRPEPLASELVGRIQADLDRRRQPLRRAWTWQLKALGLAAAAALIVAVLPPATTTHPGGESVAAPSLSPDEAAAIVSACGLLSWDSSVDYSLEAVDASVQHIERSLRGETGANSGLPWSSEDNWDVPPPGDDGSPRSQARRARLCRGLINREYDL